VKTADQFYADIVKVRKLLRKYRTALEFVGTERAWFFKGMIDCMQQDECYYWTRFRQLRNK
jgi:hypothetical protein